MRYLNAIDNAIFGEFSSILNRLAGSADEMGSFIMNLKMELSEQKVEFREQLHKKDKKIKELEIKIQKLDIGESQEGEITDLLRSINFTNVIKEPHFHRKKMNFVFWNKSISEGRSWENLLVEFVKKKMDEGKLKC